MANPNHVGILERGIQAWNEWISQSHERADLSGLTIPSKNLANIHLGGADLREINLIGADLTGAILGGADLSKAKLDNAILQYVHAESCLFRESTASQADFGKADLVDADFHSANLVGASFINAIGITADFAGAILRGADFEGAQFSQANFCRSDLRRASFIQANVQGAKLDDAFVWALRTSEWNADGLVCSAAFLDKDAKIRQEFLPDAFVREYSAPRFYHLRLSKKTIEQKLASIHALIDLIAREATEYSIQVESMDDSNRDMVVAVESMSRHREKWEDQLANYDLMIQSLSVERDEKERLKTRLEQLQDIFVQDQIGKLSRSMLVADSRWELGLIVFFDICRFSQLDENDAEERVLTFWNAGLAFLTQHKPSLNTWGDAIVCVFKDPIRGIEDSINLIESLKVQDILVRGGAHYGRIWVRSNPLTQELDFGGDNVNLAARIQPNAECGELLITNTVWAAMASESEKFEREPRPIVLKKGTRDYPTGETLATFAIRKRKI